MIAAVYGVALLGLTGSAWLNNLPAMLLSGTVLAATVVIDVLERLLRPGLPGGREHPTRTGNDWLPPDHPDHHRHEGP